MRFLFRWAFRLFLILVVLVVALVLVKDSLLKAFAEARIRSETGLDVRIGKLEAGLLSPSVTIENLRIYNTAEFGGSPLIDLPELRLEGDGGSLASRKLHFKLVRLHLNEVNIVENKDGRTNIVGILAGLEKMTSTNSRGARVAGWEFTGIDTLNLSLGKLKYVSMKKPGKTAEVDIGLRNEIITNVRSAAELSSVIISAALRKGITILGDPVSPPTMPTSKAPKKLEVTGKQPRKP
jgi:uncharacterized protein involved in outer membrane biogenesis